jgi:5-hydroxyisourate hydrolase-like protein (transthyretin family)
LLPPGEDSTESAGLLDPGSEATSSGEATESAGVAAPTDETSEETPPLGGIVEEIAEKILDPIITSPPVETVRESVEEVVETIKDTPAVQTVQETIEVIREEPVAQAAAVATTGTVATTAAFSVSVFTLDKTVKVAQASASLYKAVSAAVGPGVGVTALWQYFLSLFTSALPPIAFIRRSSRKTVGVVLDAVKNTGLKSVYLMFFTKDGLLRSAVTNADGRYSLRLESGNYSLKAQKDGYEFADIALLKQLENQYEQVYYPDSTIEFKENSFANIAIGLQAIASRSALGNALHNIAAFLKSLLHKYYAPLTIVSGLLLGTATLIQPTPLNKALLYLCLVSLMLRLGSRYLKERNYGTVLSAEGKPQIGLRMALWQKTAAGSQLYTTTTTDEKGRYQFAPENGLYTLEVSDNGVVLHTSVIRVTDQKPLVNDKIKIEKAAPRAGGQLDVSRL